MQRIALPAFTQGLRNYYLLTKPGIIMGNVITTAGGFALASRGLIDFWLFLTTLAGLSLVIGSACIFNNYIDRETDKKMARTQNRPFARGLILPRNAILLALFLGLSGIFLLDSFVNLLTAAIALFGFLVYVILYSISKYRSVHGTLIGSIAGAVPPVVGYCAISNQIDLAALLLFLIVALWQMPHFFAIAIYRLEDYAAASIPVLPLKKGIRAAKIQMLLYILAFMTATFTLTLFGYTGYAYLIVAALLGLIWLALCIQGFKSNNDKLWARKMFLFSLIIITVLCFTIPFSL